jgi:hypothetical protein
MAIGPTFSGRSSALAADGCRCVRRPLSETRPPSILARSSSRRRSWPRPQRALISAGMRPSRLLSRHQRARRWATSSWRSRPEWTLPLGILSFLLAQLALHSSSSPRSGSSRATTAPLAGRVISAMTGIGLFLLGFLIWFWRTDEFRRAPISSTLTVATLIALGVSSPVLIVSGLMYFNGEADSRPPLIAFAPLAVIRHRDRRLWLQDGAESLAAMALVALCRMRVAITAMACRRHVAALGGMASHDRRAECFSPAILVLAAELFRLPADCARAPHGRRRSCGGPMPRRRP